MSNMFYGCESLVSLPNISKWDISNVNDMRNMFNGCKSSLKLPEFYLLYLFQNYIIFELKYKINKSKKNKLKILEKKFIEKNKDKVKIIYNNCEIKINEFLNKIEINHKEKIKFILCLDRNINDLSYMFYECDSLISIDYHKINNQLYQINEQFKSISNDSNRNNDNSNTNYFGLCKNLKKSLSNYSIISNINNSNITSEIYNYLFDYPLPLTDISYMFYKCNSLISLPDISNWNTSNVNNMSNIFSECNSLISLPDISKFDTYKVNNMSNIFYGCKSLTSLPDISKWNTSNVNDMELIFNGYNSLISLPDISKWDTANVHNMGGMFYRCNLLISSSDISKWNTLKLIV